MTAPCPPMQPTIIKVPPLAPGPQTTKGHRLAPLHLSHFVSLSPCQSRNHSLSLARYRKKSPSALIKSITPQLSKIVYSTSTHTIGTSSTITPCPARQVISRSVRPIAHTPKLKRGGFMPPALPSNCLQIASRSSSIAESTSFVALRPLIRT